MPIGVTGCSPWCGSVAGSLHVVFFVPQPPGPDRQFADSPWRQLRVIAHHDTFVSTTGSDIDSILAAMRTLVPRVDTPGPGEYLEAKDAISSSIT
jgi:hypothetical protein